MTTGGQVTVDPDALQQIGRNLLESTTILGNKLVDVQRQDFGSAQAGRAYAAEGTKVHDGLARFSAWLKNWQGAVEKTGKQISTSATQYASVDDANVSKIEMQGLNLG
ncbi:hypothetical protein [Nocardia xishanensis]